MTLLLTLPSTVVIVLLTLSPRHRSRAGELGTVSSPRFVPVWKVFYPIFQFPVYYSSLAPESVFDGMPITVCPWPRLPS